MVLSAILLSGLSHFAFLEPIGPTVTGSAATAYSRLVAQSQGTGAQRIVAPGDGMKWNELIVSWNYEMPPAGKVSLRLQLEPSPFERSSFKLAEWAPGTTASASTKLERKPDGVLSVDTLKTTAQAPGVSLLTSPTEASPKLKLATFCFTNREAAIPPLSRVAQTSALQVPERFQLDYANGNNCCSPTAVAMVLSYWGEKLARADLKLDVSTVAAGVHDGSYGEGNWSFNTAYAGSLSGMRAYVTRLTETEEIRQWLLAGTPVVCSGSHYLLQGRERPKGDRGHIFVVVGFTREGDVIVNDPGRRQVRQVYKLTNFERAWNCSGRTVYLIYPESLKPPLDRLGHWVRVHRFFGAHA